MVLPQAFPQRTGLSGHQLAVVVSYLPTTLSSHETAGGVCWRGHDGVVKREIPAWYFRITKYADALRVYELFMAPFEQDRLFWDNGLPEDKTVQIPIQINGKVRAVVEVPIIADQVEVEAAAFDLLRVQQYTAGGNIVEVINVPGKIMNILTEQSQSD